MKIRRILVAVDFSESSLDALATAVDLAAVLRSSVEILCVVEPIAFAPLMGPAIDLGAVRAEQERIAGERLGALRRDVAARNVRCRASLEAGAPFRVILDHATRLPADLVVMGTHGRSGLSHLLLGSVAERVMRTAPCPVLTVRRRNRPGRGSARRR